MRAAKVWRDVCEVSSTAVAVTATVVLLTSAIYSCTATATANFTLVLKRDSSEYWLSADAISTKGSFIHAEARCPVFVVGGCLRETI